MTDLKKHSSAITDGPSRAPARANALLGWRARRGLDEICADAWRWASRFSELQRTRKLTSTGL